jgi:hypothetical protein
LQNHSLSASIPHHVGIRSKVKWQGNPIKIGIKSLYWSQENSELGQKDWCRHIVALQRIAHPAGYTLQ